MKHLKIAGLCLVAVFALSMVAAGTAPAATPEFVQCRNVGTGGHWKDSQCSKLEANGAWDTRAGGSMKDETFSSTSGVSELRTLGVSATTIKCLSDTNAGAITPDASHVLLVIEFHKCEITVGALKGSVCTTTGQEAGQILTRPLKGWLFYINESKQEVGTWLKANAGAIFAEFKCGLAKVKVKSIEEEESGSCIAGRATPVNEALKLTGGELLFKEKPANEQEIQEFTYGGKKIRCQLESEVEAKVEKDIQTSESDILTFQFDTGIRG